MMFYPWSEILADRPLHSLFYLHKSETNIFCCYYGDKLFVFCSVFGSDGGRVIFSSSDKR